MWSNMSEAVVMGICNSCRYCEGYCAVFPAMERRAEFSRADIDFLANLCDNCGACYYAYQYAPPHAFAINVPRALAQVRLENYERFAWPRRLASLYRGFCERDRQVRLAHPRWP